MRVGSRKLLEWIGLGRPSPSSPYQRMLEGLLLPKPIFDLLDIPLSQMGFVIRETSVTDAAGRMIRFQQATTDRGDYGLIHIPGDIMESEFESVADLGTALTPCVTALFFFSTVSRTNGDREKTLNYWRAHGLSDAAFFLAEHIKELQGLVDVAERKAKL